MNESHTVAVVIGSLRKESLNRKMAKALSAMAAETLRLEIVEIGDLPLFNQDYEANPPPAVKEFKLAIGNADAVLFVTPEYNRSIPGVLKNAIDAASRPYGQSAWDGKPCAVISVSPGAIGGFGANHHLRQCLVFLNMPAMPAPEAYIGGAAKLFDEKGNVTNESTRELMRKFLTAFDEWISHNSPREEFGYTPASLQTGGEAPQRRN